ncbi:glycosyltransferase, partial [Poseidonibacter sp.]|uniref:glycosyltransferase n=1 Tax=Poseidonibacter sp. TaxID=2321188 RepID=UPI003C71AA42
EESFKPVIKDFFNRNVQLQEKINFLGNITSREKIYEIYSKSKIFCMTSRYEGFPLVFPEALYFGNFIVTTDVSGAYDITLNEKYGRVIKNDDVKEYASVLTDLINTSFLNEKICTEIIDFAKEKFTWQSIVKDLNTKIKAL